MAHPFHHAESSARKYGGEPREYLALHEWLDASKSHMADFRHRALRHHSDGIFMLERLFGTTITLSIGRVHPVQFIGEQFRLAAHVAQRPRERRLLRGHLQRRQQLPSEFARAERFDGVFFVDLPGRERKDQIWGIYAQQAPNDNGPGTLRCPARL